jgi:hypothetical protein
VEKIKKVVEKIKKSCGENKKVVEKIKKLWRK